MIRLSAVMFALTVAAVLAVLPGTANAQKWFTKAVKKVEGRFSPTEAKPGQTVTFTLTVELNDGYHTYPTVQPDKMAAGMVNLIKFPEAGTVIFVGQTHDPKKFATKAEPELANQGPALLYRRGGLHAQGRGFPKGEGRCRES